MTIKRRIRLGEVLVQHKAITEEQLAAALVEQRRWAASSAACLPI